MIKYFNPKRNGFFTLGRKNIIRMSLHFDEETPHFHCVSVPIINGRLSAKKILTRQNLSNFQTDYATEMAEFGLMVANLVLKLFTMAKQNIMFN
jgi:hypothetical protein